MICLDASVVVKLLAWEPGSELASALVVHGLQRGLRLVAPDLLRYEVASALWQKVRRGSLDRAGGQKALRELRIHAVHYFSSDTLLEEAWAIAERLALPSTYDAQYLAVADNQGCPLWTADRRLAEAAAAWSGQIRLLGRDAPAGV